VPARCRSSPLEASERSDAALVADGETEHQGPEEGGRGYLAAALVQADLASDRVEPLAGEEASQLVRALLALGRAILPPVHVRVSQRERDQRSGAVSTFSDRRALGHTAPGGQQTGLTPNGYV